MIDRDFEQQMGEDKEESQYNKMMDFLRSRQTTDKELLNKIRQEELYGNWVARQETETQSPIDYKYNIPADKWEVKKLISPPPVLEMISMVNNP